MRLLFPKNALTLHPDFKVESQEPRVKSQEPLDPRQSKTKMKMNVKFKKPNFKRNLTVKGWLKELTDGEDHTMHYQKIIN